MVGKPLVPLERRCTNGRSFPVVRSKKPRGKLARRADGEGLRGSRGGSEHRCASSNNSKLGHDRTIAPQSLTAGQHEWLMSSPNDQGYWSRGHAAKPLDKNDDADQLLEAPSHSRCPHESTRARRSGPKGDFQMRNQLAIVAISTLAISVQTFASSASSRVRGRQPQLTAYVGRVPGSGRSFVEDSRVIRAVSHTLHDPAIRRTVLNPRTVTQPLTRQDKLLFYWACEPHNCGSHQWNLITSLDGSKAAVCYHDDAAQKETQWFVPGAATLKTQVDCGFQGSIPRQVARALAE